MEFLKRDCPDHPNESISNFCTNCLQGLCATCICDHTKQHAIRGSTPIYENMKDTFVKMNTKMRSQVEKMLEQKQWLIKIYESIDEKRTKIKDTLDRARDDCLRLVHKYFNETEAKIDLEIASQSKKYSLHSVHRLQTLNVLLLKQINSLQLYAKDLNSANFLNMVKNMENEIFPHSDDFHSKVAKELKLNEVYTPSVNYHSEFTAELNTVLKKLINLEFLMPRAAEYYEEAIKEEERKANLMSKGSSLLKSNTQMEDILKNRNLNSMLSPKQIAQLIIPSVTSPSPQIQNTANRFQSEVNDPMSMSKSKISTGLKFMRQSKRQFLGEQLKSANSTASGFGKQNDFSGLLGYVNSPGFGITR